MNIAKIEIAAQILTYDPETGGISLKQEIPGRKNACYRRKDGYIGVTLCGTNYLAHRIAWFLHYGRWPDGFIDHINRDRGDNRIANLRDCSRLENNQNKFGAYKNNSLGAAGVIAQRGKFRARIRVEGKLISLGYFDTIGAASAAYLDAKKRLHKTVNIQERAA